MRSLLASHLRQALTKDGAFDFLERQRGMFSLLGVSGTAVEALRTRHHIYMLGDSRMNLAGITPANVVYVAEAIAAQQDRLADRGVPFPDDLLDHPAAREQLRMRDRAGEHIELADAVHHAGEQGLVGIHPGMQVRASTIGVSAATDVLSFPQHRFS